MIKSVFLVFLSNVVLLCQLSVQAKFEKSDIDELRNKCREKTAFVYLPKPIIPTKHELREAATIPYFCFDNFRLMADHIFDETYVDFDPKKVNSGDIVFVNKGFFELFSSIVHNEIKNPYILISGNNDLSSPGPYVQILEDPKIIHWFGQNGDIVSHKKFTHLPIGLSNPFWHQIPHRKEINIKIVNQEIDSKILKKEYLLIMNFYAGSSKNKRDAYFYFNLKPFVQNDAYGIADKKGHELGISKKPHLEYMRAMAKSKFVISPHGFGLDCYRTWEALCVGSFPIVKKSTLDVLYKDLPVLIVNEWEDVTEQFLIEKYDEMVNKKYSMNKLHAQYWYDLINKVKNDYKKHLIKDENKENLIKQNLK